MNLHGDEAFQKAFGALSPYFHTYMTFLVSEGVLATEPGSAGHICARRFRKGASLLDRNLLPEA